MPAALGHDRFLRARRLFAMGLAGALVGLLALAAGASADFFTPESGGSPNADEIDSLYKLILAVAMVIFLGVEGTLLYSLIRFRARKGAVPAQIRGNTNLEMGWTVGAAVVLLVLSIVTFVKLGDIRNPPDSDATGYQAGAGGGQLYASAYDPEPPNGKSLDIKVNGQQYVWRYTYPDGDDNLLNNVFDYEELVVPTGTTVTLDIEAQDVVHSWWIPELGGKFDAVPGHTNHTWFKVPADKAGAIFEGRCAELCGRGHANMVASVRALAPADFERWMADKRNEIRQANTAAAERRKEIAAEQSQGNEAP